MGSSIRKHEAPNSKGERKRSLEEPIPSEPQTKKPCPDLKHGRQNQNKRMRSENSLDGPAQKIPKCGSKAEEIHEQQPRPGPSSDNCPESRDATGIQRYTLGSVIGDGSFGKVYKVKDNIGNKDLAVKVVEIVSSPSAWAAERAKERIYIEKEVLQLAVGSPFLIHGHLSVQILHRWYFCMDFASGGDLWNHLQKHGPFPIASATFYAAEITSGLQFLHGKGFIHRDIKLENILIDKSGHLRITDFGLALKKTEGVTGCTGTPGYMAPEVEAGKIYNVAADWYSFGVVLFEMMIGKQPSKYFIFPWTIWRLDSSAKDILKKLLTRDPERRLGHHGCIRSHPFFRQIDWAKLEELGITPPFIPGEPSTPI